MLLLEVFLLAHQKHDVAHLVHNFLFHECELVFFIGALDRLDHSSDDLDAELYVPLVEYLDLPAKQFRHVFDDVDSLACILAAQFVLQLMVMVLGQ